MPAHGKSTRVFFDAYETSDYLQDVTIGAQVDAPETSTFGVDDKQYIGGGLLDGSASLSGFYEAETDIDPTGTTKTWDEFLTGLLGASSASVVSATYGGDPDIGNRGRILSGRVTSYEISSPVADVVSSSVDLAGESASGRSGYIIADPDSTVSATGGLTSVNGGAASSNGGVAHIHVISNTCSGSSSFKLQHSTNDSTFTDITGGSFTNVSAGAISGQVVEVSGTINQYVRLHVTPGTGNLKMLCVFARR